MRRRTGRPGTTITVVVGIAVTACAVAGCASGSSGGDESGYTNNTQNLAVKISALRSDPCRTTRADQLWPDCGRYVTEVAGTIGSLRETTQAPAVDVNAMNGAVHSYQSLACDAVSGQPSAAQRDTCPKALASIGTALDRIGSVLGGLPTSP